MIQMIAVAFILGIVSWFLGCLAIIQHKYHKVKVFFKWKTFLKKKKLAALLLFLCLGIGAVVLFSVYGWLWSKTIRYLILMYGMLVIAYIDAKSHIIPNRILLVMLGIRFVWLALECLLYRDEIGRAHV